MEIVLALLLWRMLFDSQDFMGLQPPQAPGAWELLHSFACEKELIGCFCLNERENHIRFTNMPLCVHKIILKIRYLQIHTLYIYPYAVNESLFILFPYLARSWFSGPQLQLQMCVTSSVP